MRSEKIIFKLTVHGCRGHAYQLQFRDDLAAGAWTGLGAPVAGADAPLIFTHAGGAAALRRFYRVEVQP